MTRTNINAPIKRCTYFFLALAGLLMWSCKTEQSVKRDKLFIVTTTGMIADAVTNIGGDNVEVIALMGPGVDPHLYKATQGDLEKITSADIIFYNGLHLEGKMGEVLEKAGRLKPVVAIASGLTKDKLRSTEGFQETYDPHIWFDVMRWKEAVKHIAAYLQQKDTTNANNYKNNTAAYLTKLDSLDLYVRNKLAEIPLQQRVLITAHDAFGYFGDAYGVEVRGLQGISTVSEFGLRDVTQLVDFIIQRKIKAIFVETSVSEKSIQAVVEGCNSRNWPIKIGGSLYSDAMGDAGTHEGTYIGMVEANVNTIVNALK